MCILREKLVGIVLPLQCAAFQAWLQIARLLSSPTAFCCSYSFQYISQTLDSEGSLTLVYGPQRSYIATSSLSEIISQIRNL